MGARLRRALIAGRRSVPQVNDFTTQLIGYDQCIPCPDGMAQPDEESTFCFCDFGYYSVDGGNDETRCEKCPNNMVGTRRP